MTVATQQDIGYRNRLEKEYGDYLNHLKRKGEIYDCRYEPIRLKLAWNTTYLPDFMVIKLGQPIEFHETKGRKFEAGMAKLKIATTRFPWFYFFMVEKQKKNWVIKKIPISD